MNAEVQRALFTPGFPVQHASSPSMQLLCLGRIIPYGGESYPASDGERADHVKGDTGLGTTLPIQVALPTDPCGECY